jgi:hypothetical protein
MKEFDDTLRIPTQEEFEQLQKENPDVTVVSFGKDAFEAARKEHQQRVKDEEDFPILKATPEGFDLFSAQQELKRSRSLFIQKLELTSIKAAVQGWLRNMHGETRRNYAYYVTDMMRRGIIPEVDAEGQEFTVGHFNHIPHEKVIDFIKTVEDWSEGTRQVRAACYISFT